VMDVQSRPPAASDDGEAGKPARRSGLTLAAFDLDPAQHSPNTKQNQAAPPLHLFQFSPDHPRFQIMYRGVPVLLQRYCAASAGLLRVLTVLRDYDSTSLQHKLQRMRCADVIFKLHISKALALPSHTVGLERALRCKCET